MAKILSSDINNANNTIYNYGTQSKQQSSLPSSLQSSTGNNVTAGSKITPVNIENIKKAINTLEQKFSKNCCQSNCNSTTTSCQQSTQVNCYTPCQVNCYTPCQVNCYTPCQVNCYTPCQVNCYTPCQSQCYTACQSQCYYNYSNYSRNGDAGA